MLHLVAGEILTRLSYKNGWQFRLEVFRRVPEVIVLAVSSLPLPNDVPRQEINLRVKRIASRNSKSMIPHGKRRPTASYLATFVIMAILSSRGAIETASF